MCRLYQGRSGSTRNGFYQEWRLFSYNGNKIMPVGAMVLFFQSNKQSCYNIFRYIMVFASGVTDRNERIFTSKYMCK